jgi:hypothetical protein
MFPLTTTSGQQYSSRRHLTSKPRLKFPFNSGNRDATKTNNWTHTRHLHSKSKHVSKSSQNSLYKRIDKSGLDLGIVPKVKMWTAFMYLISNND